MKTTCDALILGLGAIGSAALYQLAKQGQKVLGVDQFSPPHIYGSSHGETRIIRQAIGEGEGYTPLSVRAYELWKEIEGYSGQRLFTQTGGLVIDNGSSKKYIAQTDFFTNTVTSAKKYHIPHHLLNANELRYQFPQFNVNDNAKGFYEYTAGFLYPEQCITSQMTLAKQHGAIIHKNEKIEYFRQTPYSTVYVKTNQGHYEVKNLILCAGSWISQLLNPSYSHLFTPTRQISFWFGIRDNLDYFSPQTCPIFIMKGIDQPFYGFPAIQGLEKGVKIARGNFGDSTGADTINRHVSPKEISNMFQGISRYLPGLDARCIKTATCLYTLTPDNHFIIDWYPEIPSVLLVSPCSGHGFKYSAAIGEVVAQLVMNGSSECDISRFGLSRFNP